MLPNRANSRKTPQHGKQLRVHEVPILHVNVPSVAVPNSVKRERGRQTNDHLCETSLPTAKSMSACQLKPEKFQLILPEDDLSDDQLSHSDSGSEFSIDFDDIEFPAVSPRTTELKQSLLINMRTVCWEDSARFHHACNKNYTPVCDILGVRSHQQSERRDIEDGLEKSVSRSFSEKIRVEDIPSFLDNSKRSISAPVQTFSSTKPCRKTPFVLGNPQEVFGSGLLRRGSLKSHQEQVLVTPTDSGLLRYAGPIGLKHCLVRQPEDMT